MRSTLPLRLVWLSIAVSPIAFARVAVISSETESIEIPRSQIKTYIQRQSLEQSLRTVKQVKPSALPDEELAAIPERYLPPELKERQREIKRRLREKSKEIAQKKAAPKVAVGADGKPLSAQELKRLELERQGEVVRVRDKSGKSTVQLKIDEAVWVPPTAAVNAALLAPQRRLPSVQLLQEKVFEAGREIVKEIAPGERREILELFPSGFEKDPVKAPLTLATKAYSEEDYATAVTLALGVMSDTKENKDTRELAKYLAAHSLFQAGFYASATPLLGDLVDSKLRRSAIGMIARCLEKTRDDSAANQVLAKVSLSQIPEDLKPLFGFHLGRILLNTGAAEPAAAAFRRVPQDHPRYAEAQYFLGVLGSSSLASGVQAADWEREGSSVQQVRAHFDAALLAARTRGAVDLLDLTNMALARLAYQVGQYNQAVFYYDEIRSGSPLVRESLFESAWAMYRLGEFNRTLGSLHALGSSYFEAQDLPDVWILRSLSYLKLCRFDEARTAANTFQSTQQRIQLEVDAIVQGKSQRIRLQAPSDLKNQALPEWLKATLLEDLVVTKDLSSESLLLAEMSRLQVLSENPRVLDAELRSSATDALKGQLQRKIQAVGKALEPYVLEKLKTMLSDYKNQRERLDFLRFEIYSQASRFPQALSRPEANALIKKGDFLPGVFLKGNEILWRFAGESWVDELRGYDYFVPTECKASGSI